MCVNWGKNNVVFFGKRFFFQLEFFWGFCLFLEDLERTRG